MEFRGTLVALVTPMTLSGEIDTVALRHLVDWHLRAGTDALVVLGTTGEAATLSESEQEAVVLLVIEQVAGKIPVIVGTGCHCTRATIENTQRAKQLGAQAALVVTPYYNKPTQQGMIAHYRAIADAVDVPIMLYNVPSRTAVDLSNEAICALSEHPNIVALKEASGQVARVGALKASGLSLLSGDDASAYDFIQAGGQGVVSVVANIAPELTSSMVKASLAGQPQAQTLNQQLQPLYTALFLESNPIPVKQALVSMGKIRSFLRLPLTPLSEHNIDKLHQAMSVAKIALSIPVKSVKM